MMSSKGARPITAARPITGARPITTTGLMAPKSSRGRTGLRRQIQDKSYWVGVIKAKMSELNTEIATLSKECDTMSQDESRMGSWQKKAEGLARELATLSHELTVYNEFKDRLRVGETGEELKDEIDELKHENEQMVTKLEITYEDKKQKEEEIKSTERDIERMQDNWENLRKQFTPEQQNLHLELEVQNKELTMKCEQLENRIQQWLQKKSELENISHLGSDSFLRKEILQALERLRDLEKQRDDLIGETTSGDERGRLLAQVKRDNKEISTMEAQYTENTKEIEQIRSDLEAYEDTEATEKYRELKQKELTMDEFLNRYENEKEEDTQKMNDYVISIDDSLSKIARIISHIDGLKSNEDDPSREGFDGLLDEKRKLELDMNKIEQLETKIHTELDSLRNKIKTLEKDIVTYSDIPKLKRNIEDKNDKLKDDCDKYREQIAELRKANKLLKEQLDSAKDALDSNEVYVNIKKHEGKLSEVLAQNAKIDAVVSANDNTQIKKAVMDEVKKYNQKLQGY